LIQRKEEMKAIGYAESLPISHERSLFEFETRKPEPGARDLLVRIHAVGMNPLDTVDRMRRAGTADAPLILGWDAAGVVEAVGSEVTLFRPGDEVYYSGTLLRPGSNAEYGVVDERIAARKPRSLSFKEAAAIPLTAITAWECLFDRLRVQVGKGSCDDAILMIGAAGGVGSMAIQLARRLTPLNIIATASRRVSENWVRELGAHEVVDHSKPLSAELERIGHSTVRYVLSCTETAKHWDEIAKCVAPQGAIVVTDIPAGIDPLKIRRKAAALIFELMMVRVIYPGQDMIQIHRLLTEVARMVDEGTVRSTLAEDYGPLSAVNVKRAHAALESGRTVGKIVLGGIGIAAS
jgi:zinc-binding alcohol dehydrogenase family protein